MLNLKRLVFLPLILLLAGCEYLGGLAEFYQDVSKVRYQKGDDLAWAEMDFDDSAWPEAWFHEVKNHNEMVWVRTTFEGQPFLDSNLDEPVGFMVQALAASEVYLNGEKLGENGKPGATKDLETPGQVDALFYIPREKIKPGENLIAVRLSTHHLQMEVFANLYNLSLLPHKTPTFWVLKGYVPALLLFGVFLVGAAFFILRGALGRFEPTSFWLGLAALMVAGQLAAEQSRAYFIYTYDWHLVRIIGIHVFAIGFGFALTMFSGFFFLKKLPKPGLVVGLVAAPLIFFLVPGFDSKTLITLGIFFLISSGLGVWAWFKGERQNKLVLGCLLISTLLIPISYGLFLDRYYFFVVAFILGTLFTVEVLDARDRERRMQNALIQSTRLELELLKHHIQPHFLMNTLTALSEWMERNPKTGSQMIETLAEEFRLLHEITAEKLIPLSKELALCKAHLKLMGYRKNANLELKVDIQDQNVLVPPCIFHTMLENALTHGTLRLKNPEFQLVQTSEGEDFAYTFTTPLGKKKAKGAQSTGLGMSYVRARLEEAFEADFSLEFGEEKGGKWATRVTFPKVNV